MPLDGFLFDLDGTLVDSNRAHVRAWARSLERHGYRVGADRIAIEIGKGGDHLVPSLLGVEADTRDGDAIRHGHDAELERLVRSEGVAPMAGAVELLAALRTRGLRTALATSSGTAQIELMERGSGIRWRQLVDEVAGKDEAAATKPAPDIVRAALARLGLTPAQCAMLGDTRWDAESARRAGVILVGVSADDRARELRQAGARLVFRDPAAFLADLDNALCRLAPGSLRLDAAALEQLTRAALAAAEDGMNDGEAPIGAVIARGDGTIIGRGWNRLNRSQDPSIHAEIDAFHAAAGKLDLERRDGILVSSLEPCVLCTGAAMECAIDVVVHALAAPADAGTGRVTPPESPEGQMPRIVDASIAVNRELAEHSLSLFRRWLVSPRHNRAQEPYIRQLLDLHSRRAAGERA